MKLYFLFFFLVIIIAKSPAQTYNVDTLHYSGDKNKHINLVILGDGYREADLPKFRQDAQNFQQALFVEEPFSHYKNYFNIFIINVPSTETGADHPGTATDVQEPAHPVEDRNTYFNSTFDYSSIHRLLVAKGTGAAYSVLAQNFPDYDQAVMLVNTGYYGGSGGPIPVSATDGSATEIALHELGHSFAYLADEYWAGDQFAAEKPNMTKTSDPLAVKWKNWYGDEGIGIFQHCCGGVSGGWYRPHQNCKMRALNNPFCAVCREAIIERIHGLASPIERFSPIGNNLNAEQQPMTFKTDLIKPEPNSLNTVWQLNGSQISQNVDSVTIAFNSWQNGANTITVLVEDTSSLLRVTNHSAHLYALNWTVQKQTSGVQSARPDAFEVQVFPNPANNRVHVEAEVQGRLTLKLFDLNGKKLMETRSNQYDSSSGKTMLELNLDQIQESVLMLHVETEAGVVLKKIIKR